MRTLWQLFLAKYGGQGARSQICKKYIFEYITMIENIVKEGIEKGELSKGDPNVIASGIFGIACSSLIYKMRIDKKLK